MASVSMDTCVPRASPPTACIACRAASCLALSHVIAVTRHAQQGFSWLALLQGRKLWYFAPGPWPRPLPPDCDAAVNAVHANATAARTVAPLGATHACVQQPGEVMIVPTAFWHATCNLGPPPTIGWGGQDLCDAARCSTDLAQADNGVPFLPCHAAMCRGSCCGFSDPSAECGGCDDSFVCNPSAECYERPSLASTVSVLTSGLDVPRRWCAVPSLATECHAIGGDAGVGAGGGADGTAGGGGGGGLLVQPVEELLLHEQGLVVSDVREGELRAWLDSRHAVEASSVEMKAGAMESGEMRSVTARDERIYTASTPALKVRGSGQRHKEGYLCNATIHALFKICRSARRGATSTTHERAEPWS